MPKRRKRTRPDNRKAVAVVRVSSGEQVLGQSLEQQEQKIREECAKLGLYLVRVFRQEGESAGMLPFIKRSGGEEIAGMIERGEVSHLVATKLDRVFRNVLDCLSWVEDWERSGLKIHFFDEPYLMDKRSKAVSGLILRERASYAEFERDLASERTKAALAYRRARGEVYTRIPPFGFERGPGSKLVPVPEEQRIIARMRRMRSQHLGYRTIADRLNKDGVPTKLPGGKWYPTAVSRVLAREVPASVPENRRNSE